MRVSICGPNSIPSKIQKITYKITVNKKLMKDCTVFDIKNKYFGTLIFVKIGALAISARIHP
jgi:hypothetical protein